METSKRINLFIRACNLYTVQYTTNLNSILNFRLDIRNIIEKFARKTWGLKMVDTDKFTIQLAPVSDKAGLKGLHVLLSFPTGDELEFRLGTTQSKYTPKPVHPVARA